MIPEILDTIAPLIALLGVGTFGLIGMRMWLNSKGNKLAQGGHNDVERLGEALDGLHDQVRLLREDLGELHERVDYAERLLARSSSAGATDHGDATPT
jgi:hypothetical protein